MRKYLLSAGTGAVVLMAMLVAVPTPSSASGGGGANASARSIASRLSSSNANSTCAIDFAGGVRCWGEAAQGRLGYGNTDDIGNDETVASAGTVDLGAGRTALAVSAGGSHTCVILDTHAVRCWGGGSEGALGYGDEDDIGDDEATTSVGTVNLGAGRTATAVAAGGRNTCVILDTGAVKCWGQGIHGVNGQGNTDDIGDDPGEVAAAGTVNLGTGRTATSIEMADDTVCAILDNGDLLCWGQGGDGKLGHGNSNKIGDNETPDTVGPINLGVGRTAKAVALGSMHVCAILDTDAVSCWGAGNEGRTGYGYTTTFGDDPGETPNTRGTVDLGGGRTAVAISAGEVSCALLDDGTVRCWGGGLYGMNGAGTGADIGDDEDPGDVAPVSLGARSVVAIATGFLHSCAARDDGSVICWGEADHGKLGNQSGAAIGDDELPSTNTQALNSDVQQRLTASVGSANADEGTTAHVPITLTHAAPWTVTVDWEAVGNSASSDDFTPSSGTVTYAPGETTKYANVPLLADDEADGSETIGITLSSPSPTITLSSFEFTVNDVGPDNDDDDDDDSESPGRNGYWMAEADGDVYAFGDSKYFGGTEPYAATVDIEASPGIGYWTLQVNGEVRGYGDVTFYEHAKHDFDLVWGEVPVAISGAIDSEGYWIVTNYGRVKTFGSAKFYGDMTGTHLNQTIVDAIAAPNGKGYYMVGSDGGVFSFGSASFRGSMGSTPLNAPVQSIVADIDGEGYWLVASDGGVFSFDAAFHGSMGGQPLNQPISGMATRAGGYILVAEDGGAFAFDLAFRGSLGGTPPNTPIVAITTPPSYGR